MTWAVASIYRYRSAGLLGKVFDVLGPYGGQRSDDTKLKDESEYSNVRDSLVRTAWIVTINVMSALSMRGSSFDAPVRVLCPNATYDTEQISI